jgi:hypothetical protein
MATLAKLVGSVFRFHFSQVGKQGTRLGKKPEYFSALPAERDERGLDVRLVRVCELLPVVANRPIILIHVFGIQVRNIGLRVTQIPTEFIKRTTLRILLAGDDFDMLFVFDRPFLSTFDPGPKFESKPVHAGAEVLQSPEECICPHAAGGHASYRVGSADGTPLALVGIERHFQTHRAVCR